MFGFSAEEKLREAIIDGNVADAEKILSSQKIDLNMKDEDGLTFLMLAVNKSSAENVKLLISKGADIHEMTPKSWKRALLMAVERGYLPIVEILLDAGADVNRNDAADNTPLSIALAEANQEIACLLINKGADIEKRIYSSKMTPLIKAAISNLPQVVDLLLAKGADINARDSAGDTALMHALRYCRDDIALQLIQKGADPLTVNSRKSTALIEAAEHGQYDIVKALIDKGAPLDAQNDDGYSALLCAVNRSHTDIAELLIDKGANLNLTNRYGENIWDLAGRRSLHALIKKINEITKPARKEVTETSEAWTRLGKDKIAHIGIYPEIQKKITNIFNFTTRQQIVISENLALQSEAVSPAQSFDDISAESLREAFNAFIEQGGKADEAKVFRYTRLDKPSSPPPGK